MNDLTRLFDHVDTDRMHELELVCDKRFTDSNVSISEIQAWVLPRPLK